ncbi:MAG: hypothetical protein MUE80_08830 [Acidobacteria bacterium]|nr:hypothetical protein [Acidobacteriota bacterium]
MKLKITITTRLVFWIALLVLLLVGAVLFVIQIREAKILKDETEERALIQARYVADYNLLSLVRQDWTAVQRYIDDHVKQDLAYIVVYDRQGQPQAANGAVRPHVDVVASSLLPEDALEGETGSGARTLTLEGRSVRILEREVPAFSPQSAQRWGSVKIGISLEPMYDRVREVQKVLLLIGLGGFVGRLRPGHRRRVGPGPPHHPAPAAPGRRHRPHRPRRLLPVDRPPGRPRRGRGPGPELRRHDGPAPARPRADGGGQPQARPAREAGLHRAHGGDHRPRDPQPPDLGQAEHPEDSS